MAMDSVLLPLQLAVTGALAGLGWTVQLAIYALFASLIRNLDGPVFIAYHAAYTRAMGWVAAPLMLAELGLAITRVATFPHSTSAQLGLALVIAIWSLTFGWIVPVHRRLQAAPTETDARRITRLNGFRSALWTAHVATLVWMATHAGVQATHVAS